MSSKSLDFANSFYPNNNHASPFMDSLLPTTRNILQDESTVKSFEGGFHANPYNDNQGNPTIGYGHKLTADEISSGQYKNGISKEKANQLFNQDMETAIKKTQNQFNNFDSMQPEAQAALIDMTYNMGSINPKAWPNFMDAANSDDVNQEADYQRMADESRRDLHNGDNQKNDNDARNKWTNDMFNKAAKNKDMKNGTGGKVGNPYHDEKGALYLPMSV